MKSLTAVSKLERCPDAGGLSPKKVTVRLVDMVDLESLHWIIEKAVNDALEDRGLCKYPDKDMML
jgi:hypothetical protein